MSLDPRRSNKPIIHSRESSRDSRTSDSSWTSAEVHSSTSTRGTMANGGYKDNERVEYHRVPDNERHFVTATTSTTKSGRTVRVIDQRAGISDPQAPRVKEATYEDYKRTQQTRRRDSRR